MVSDIISIVKDGNGTMTVKAWGSVDIKDKQGQRLPIDELVKDAPYMMENGPKTHWGHTDIEVGPIKDLQVADKVTKAQGLRKGMIVTVSVPGNRRYLQKIQKQLETGKYQMSIRGFSYAKSTDGDAEILRDVEGINYAWVPKGANPEADTIDIDGVTVKKSDDVSLTNQPSFMNEVKRNMEEGLPYSKAFQLAKDLYNSMVLKEDTNEEAEYITYDTNNTVNKEGEDTMSDEDKAIKDQFEALKKEFDELKEQHTSLVKEKEAIAKERDGLSSELEEVKKSKTPTSISKEDVEAMVEAKTENIKKSVMDEMMKDDGAAIIKALGYTPFKGSEAPGITDIIKSQTSEGLVELQKSLAQAVHKGTELIKNEDIDSIPSYAEMEKAIIGGE